VLLSLDFANGFNSMYRHLMLKRLYALPELSLLWRIADLCYGIPSPLHLFGREDLVATLTSERGSRQGCVLGTLLFCLGLQPILEEASRGLDNLSVSAYVDDIAAVGPLEQASVFFERLSALSPTLASCSRCPSLLCSGLPGRPSLTAFSAGQMSISFLSCEERCLSLDPWLALIRTFGSLPPSGCDPWSPFSMLYGIHDSPPTQISFCYVSAPCPSSISLVVLCLHG